MDFFRLQCYYSAITVLLQCYYSAIAPVFAITTPTEFKVKAREANTYLDEKKFRRSLRMPITADSGTTDTVTDAGPLPQRGALVSHLTQ